MWAGLRVSMWITLSEGGKISQMQHCWDPSLLMDGKSCDFGSDLGPVHGALLKRKEGQIISCDCLSAFPRSRLPYLCLTRAHILGQDIGFLGSWETEIQPKVFLVWNFDHPIPGC